MYARRQTTTLHHQGTSLPHKVSPPFTVSQHSTNTVCRYTVPQSVIKSHYKRTTLYKHPSPASSSHPTPLSPAPVAVYNFSPQTGQRIPNWQAQPSHSPLSALYRSIEYYIRNQSHLLRQQNRIDCVCGRWRTTSGAWSVLATSGCVAASSIHSSAVHREPCRRSPWTGPCSLSVGRISSLSIRKYSKSCWPATTSKGKGRSVADCRRTSSTCPVITSGSYASIFGCSRSNGS